ncbi:MAG: cytochrome c biogenesis protein CcsA [Methanosarcinales archaeon]|nr:cytochrome c biogenesis protein CcsA [Methanosarcinales archaeon]
METGDSLLFLAIVTNVIILAGLLLKELKNDETFMPWMTWLLRGATALLTIDLLLLTSYFVNSNFRYIYVWQYSSLDLSLFYKISAVLAGQSGTLLFWVWVIVVSAFWLSEKHGWNTPLIRRTQLVTLLVGLYLMIMTFKISPFETIFVSNPSLPPNFMPDDGSGLNTLLITPWMAIHPPTLFIGYGLMTIPFAAAMVYLFTGEKGWEPIARQWGRLTWLFLTWGIALGGLWAYLILGWGGFWAWDPVETSSFIPWLVLTGFLHAISQHRKNEKNFQLAAPLFAAFSFATIIYAALVTRSGLFNSVHAFGESDTGTYLLVLTLISVVVPTVAVVLKYLKTDQQEPQGPDMSFKEIVLDVFEKQNLFLITLILFGLLTLVSVWGITFPVIQQLLADEKVAMAPQAVDFFNVNSYPVVIVMLLVAGYCLQYTKGKKTESLKTLGVVVVLTVLVSFYKMKNFHVLDHTTPFYLSQPPLYRFLGEISVLSIIPPLGYLLYAILQTFSDDVKKYHGKRKMLISRSGMLLIHLGVVFILFGTPISVSFGSTASPTLSQNQLGSQVDVGNGYSLMLNDVKTAAPVGSYPGTPIRSILANPQSYSGTTVEVSGKVVEKYDSGRYSYLTIDDGTGQMQIATDPVEINNGEEITATGLMMVDFVSQSTGEVYPAILFSNDARYLTVSGGLNTQQVYLTVFKNGREVGDGYAEYVTGPKGSATHPMVVRKLTKDIYILFQGKSESGSIPLTFKLIPMVNEVWLGIVFFSVGISMIMVYNPNPGTRKKRHKKV